MDKYYMKLAITEAKKAYLNDEVPVGAIIIQNNKILARAYNKKEKNNSSLDHAELLCIKKASKKNKNWRLDDCTIYITMQPCIMCCGAIIESRIKKVVYGCRKPDNSFLDIKKLLNINNIEVVEKILDEETSKIIKDFFKTKRKNNLKNIQ